MRYQAVIEPISACIRIFEDASVPGKDPYIWSATVVYHNDGKAVEFKGVTTNGKVPFSAMRKDVLGYLDSLGIEEIMWTRRSVSGRQRLVRYHVPTGKRIR